MIRSACVLFVALVFAAESSAQVRLEHKFQTGKYQQEANVDINQTMSIAGMEVVTKNNVQVTTEVSSQRRDGDAVVTEKVKSMQVSMSVQGMEYSFDSDSPDTAGDSQLEMLRDYHKLAARGVTTIVFDKTGKVASVKNSMQEEVKNLPEMVQNIVKGELSSENLKQTTEQSLNRLPKGLVSKGDAWDRTEKANLGQGQIMTFQVRYTYEGAVENDGKTLDKISFKSSSVDLSFADDSPVKDVITASDLKIAESSGHLLFDRKLGRTVQEQSSTRIKGDLTFNANGMEFPATLDLKMESKTIVK